MRVGEFTDDTHMALALAQSLIACGGFDADDVWTRFVAWRRKAKDCGILTGRVLSRRDWPGAAYDGHIALNRSAANGALMRVTPIALAWSGVDEATLMTVARAQAALTHFDAAAGWGAAIGAALIRRAVLGEDPIAALPEVLAHVDADERERFALMLDASWEPNNNDDPSNGSVWTCLAQAVWAVRHNDRFEDVLVAAIELGGDTDTVAAIVGSLAGCEVGVDGIPVDWREGLVDWPRSPRLLGRLAVELGSPGGKPVRWFWPGILARNLFFLAVVLAHGFRRLLPPY